MTEEGELKIICLGLLGGTASLGWISWRLVRGSKRWAVRLPAWFGAYNMLVLGVGVVAPRTLGKFAVYANSLWALMIKNHEHLGFIESLLPSSITWLLLAATLLSTAMWATTGAIVGVFLDRLQRTSPNRP